MSSIHKLSLNNISKKYGEISALSPLSLGIKKGELVALIGPSGAGKSTLLNLLAHSLTPDQGQILVDGMDTSEISSNKERAKKIGLIRQQFDLIEPLPVLQNVLVGNFNRWNTGKSLFSLIMPQGKKEAFQALNRVGLEDKAYFRTSQLSGGQKQRVALARLLVQKPEIILADEPIASLDPARAEDIIQILTELVKEGDQTLIASLHSVEYAKKYFTRIIGLRDGEVFFDLPTSKVTHELLEGLYEIKGNIPNE